MTVSAQTSFIAHAGAGTTGPFAVPFRFLQPGDLVLEKEGADGLRARLTPAAVTGAGEDAGGAVQTAEPVAAGETLRIWRETPRVQPVDYIAADAFPAETHEGALDRLTLIAQDQARDLGRTLKVSPGDEAPADVSYAQIITDVAAKVGDNALAQIAAAGAEEVGAVSNIGELKIALINNTAISASVTIENSGQQIADRLGLSGGVLLDVIPTSEGYDEGFAVTDDQGWVLFKQQRAGHVGAVTRIKVQGADFSTLGNGQIGILPRLAIGALFYHRAFDPLINGSVLKNSISNLDADENIFLYDTGYMPNESVGPAVSHGVDGDWVEITHLTTSDVYAFWSNSLPPAGNYGIRFEIRSKAGAGIQSIRYGNPAALQSATISEAPSVIEFDFSATGLATNYNSFGIRGSGSNSPAYLVRRRIMKQGVAAIALPAWGSLKRGNWDARPTMAWPNSLPKIGNYIDNSGSLGRMAMRSPSHPLMTTFNAQTMIVAVQLVATGQGLAMSADVDSVAGTSPTTIGIGASNIGNVEAYPNGIGVGRSGWARVLFKGTNGIHFLVLRMKDGEQRAGFHEIDFNWDTDPYSGFEARVLRYMGASSSTNFKGRFYSGAFWDRFLSDQEVYESIAKMEADLKGAGSLRADFDWAIVPGDSRTASAIPSGTKWIDQVSSDGHYAPNLFTWQWAAGGRTIDLVVANDLPGILRMAKQAVMANRTALVTMLLGTNDSSEIISDPVAYLDRQISQIWMPIRSVTNGARIYIAPWNEIGRYTVGWNSSILTYASEMSNKVGVIFNSVLDSQATNCGAQNSSNFSSYFQENPNYVHPNAAGNDDFVPLVDDLVTRYRDWKAAL